MTTFVALCRRAALPALPLLLAACTASQQGNRTVIGFDQDELSAVRLQTFKLGAADAVLRRTVNRGYQIKLYDRMKLIDLGRIDNPRVVGAVRAPGYDLIAVEAPTPACPYAHRLYELKGLAVGMWEVNNTPGKCRYPVTLSTDGQSWLAHQNGGRNDSLVWFWNDGKMVSMLDPAQDDARKRQAAAPGAGQGDTRAAPASGTARRPLARFESGDAAPAAAGARNDDAAPATPAVPARGRVAAAPAQAAPSAPSAAPRRIDAGRYTKLPSNGVTEIAPTKVTLRDAD